MDELAFGQGSFGGGLGDPLGDQGDVGPVVHQGPVAAQFPVGRGDGGFSGGGPGGEIGVGGGVEDGEAIYVILDNLNHHKNRDVRQWCDANNVQLLFTPTYASWANPIEAHFGPLRQFVLANSDHPDHPTLGRAIRSYLRWRNTHTRDPRVLEAERRHRAKIRGEQQRRWGHPRRSAA